MEEIFDDFQHILEQLLLSGIHFIPTAQIKSLKLLQSNLEDLALSDGAKMVEQLISSEDRSELFVDLVIWFQTVEMTYYHMIIEEGDTDSLEV